MNVTSRGLALLANSCGAASAQELSTLSRHERLNGELAVTLALLRANRADLQRSRGGREEVKAVGRRLILLNTRLREIRAALAVG
jgi:hypothetical protein